MNRHAEEVAKGRRFRFGKNWAAFLSTLDDARIAEAEKSLQGMLGCERFESSGLRAARSAQRVS